MIFRPNKGDSIISFPDDYVVLDIETTGYDQRFDEIIEIGVLKIRNDIIVDQFNTFVNPGKKISVTATEHTGITNEMLVGAPRFSDIADAVINFIDTDVIIGHNVNYDINFIYDRTRGKLSNDFIDTLRMSRKYAPALEHHRLADMVEYFDLKTDRLHRSISDCKATLALYLKLKEIITDHDAFVKSFIKKRDNRNRHYLNAKDIVASVDEFDEEHPFYDKNVAFTGGLDEYTRADAMQIVTNLGGHCQNSVTRKTNFLILGNTNYYENITGEKSAKYKKAEELKLKGFDIEIISENVFNDLISQ